MRALGVALVAGMVLAAVGSVPVRAMEVGAEAGVTTMRLNWPPGHVVSPARVLRVYLTLGNVSGYDVAAVIDQVGVMGAGLYPDADNVCPILTLPAAERSSQAGFRGRRGGLWAAERSDRRQPGPGGTPGEGGGRTRHTCPPYSPGKRRTLLESEGTPRQVRKVLLAEVT